MPYRTFPSWPRYEEDEIAAVTRVLESGKVNYWTGDEVGEFEREFARAVGCAYAVACANGSLALDLALRSLELDSGDEVVVTPRTFVASASCIALIGARPVFADVDSDSQNITAKTVHEAITSNTKAILCVHLAGRPCDMDPILALAERHGLWVLEDCAQAHGARYKGHPVGSLGHVAAWSFCQDKILTTGGEGGMLTTNDPAICERAWSFKDHGKSRSAIQQKASRPGFKWVHESLGTNYRLTGMQAAIGRVQLGKLERWVERRNTNAALLTEGLRGLRALRLPETPHDIRHAYYKYYAFVRPEKLRPGWDRDRILELLSREGIPCGSGVCPEVYLEKPFQDTGMCPEKRLSGARELGETSLMFPVHPTLDASDMKNACDVIRSILKQAEK